MKQTFESYIALGDSLTEGLGDTLVKTHRTYGGWADRLATLLSLESQARGDSFWYANLAIRGSKTSKILGEQAESAIKQKAQLITVMAGANDMICNAKQLGEIELLFRRGISELAASGAQIVLINIAIPDHHWIGHPLVKYAKQMSQLINRIGAEFSLPLVDLAGQSDFANLEFWCDDLAHYSEAGHVRIANLVAEKIGLRYRWPELELHELAKPSRDARSVYRWYRFEVIPLFIRRMRGKTSGDGMPAKFPQLEELILEPTKNMFKVKLPQKNLEKSDFVSEMGLEPTPA